MESDTGTVSRRQTRNWLVPLIGYTIAIACLVWVYHGFDWRSELPRLLRTDWRWVTIAAVADVSVYILQGWRWSLLLKPLERVPVIKSVQAVYIGLFANEVLPLRSGEVIRTFLMAKWTRLRFSVVVSTVLAERLLDGIWLVIGLYIAAQYVELPGYLVTGSEVMALVLVVFAALLVYAVLHKTRAKEAVKHHRWSQPLHNMVDSAHDMGRSPSFLVAAVLSLCYLGLQIMPIYALMRGYGMDAALWHSAVVFVVLRIGTVVPALPGNLGTFQAATVLGLRLCGIARDDATGFATLLFVVVTVPLWIGGFIALVATRMRLQEIHRDAHETFSNGTTG